MDERLIHRILAFVEFADGDPDLSYAVDLARQLNSELILFAVIDTPAMVSLIGRSSPQGAVRHGGTLTESVTSAAEAYLQSRIDDATALGVNVRGHVIVSEEVPEQILKEAMMQHVDLILVRSHGRSGLMKALFGSTVANVLSAAPCPVLVAQA